MSIMLRYVIFSGLAIGYNAGVAFAEGGYTPPPVGAQITWSVPTDTGTETRVSEVVANGPDFAIYLYDMKWNADNPWAYFVEFSGLHASACNLEMPTPEERRQLNSLWPLRPGTEIAVEAEFQTVYKVNNPVSYTKAQLNGDRAAQSITKVIGERSSQVTLSHQWKMPVSEEWEDGWVMNALDVFIPALPERAIDISELGHCGSLFQ